MTRRVLTSAAAMFALVVPFVAAADPLRPPDGTYRYELRIHGGVDPIGSDWPQRASPAR